MIVGRYHAIAIAIPVVVYLVTEFHTPPQYHYKLVLINRNTLVFTPPFLSSPSSLLSFQVMASKSASQKAPSTAHGSVPHVMCSSLQPAQVRHWIINRVVKINIQLITFIISIRCLLCVDMTTIRVNSHELH